MTDSGTHLAESSQVDSPEQDELRILRCIAEFDVGAVKPSFEQVVAKTGMARETAVHRFESLRDAACIAGIDATTHDGFDMLDVRLLPEAKRRLAQQGSGPAQREPEPGDGVVAAARERWVCAKGRAAHLADEFLDHGSGYGDADAKEGDNHRVESARYEAERLYREYQAMLTRAGTSSSSEELEPALHHCNRCLRETSHQVVHREENRWRDEIELSSGVQDFWQTEWYDVIKCRGCGAVSILMTSQSEAKEEPLEEFFPPRTFRRTPAWLGELPRDSLFKRSFVSELIDEIYVALQNGSLRLAVMGVRALLEAAMIDKVGDHGSFRKNVAKFESSGFISEPQREALEATIEAGHAVTHRRHSPDQAGVVRLMDLAESIIESVFVSPEKARVLAEGTPKRK